MATIYVVTSGIYDLTIDGVYDTHEKAEYAKRLFNADGIEKFELNTMPEHIPDMLMFSVRINKEGNCVYENPLNPRIFRMGPDHDESWHPVRDNEVVFYVWARDEEDALKIAKERRTQLVTSGEWTTDYREWKSRQVKAVD